MSDFSQSSPDGPWPAKLTPQELNTLTGTILDAVFEVSNLIGAGFYEKVYENALVIELEDRGIDVAQQVPVPVRYKGREVGRYVTDLVVADHVLLELKATLEDHPVYVAQTLNYLRATGLPLGFLINFGTPKVRYRRLVWHGGDKGA